MRREFGAWRRGTLHVHAHCTLPFSSGHLVHRAIPREPVSLNGEGKPSAGSAPPVLLRQGGQARGVTTHGGDRLSHLDRLSYTQPISMAAPPPPTGNYTPLPEGWAEAFTGEGGRYY